jgi:hypothetical protein
MSGPALAGFPVLTTSNQLTSEFFAGVLASGADVVVCAADGITKLPREVANINAVGGTIELYHASPAGESVYYVYFGNAAGAEVNSTSVWDASFLNVWHMTDGENTSHIHDSTSAANHGAKKAAAHPAQTDGAFSGDKAQVWVPTDNDWIKPPNHVHCPDAFTIEFIWQRVGASIGTVHSLFYGLNAWFYNDCGVYSAGNAFFMELRNHLLAYKYPIVGMNNPANWHYLTGFYDGTNVRCQFNATQGNALALGGTLYNPNSHSPQIGFRTAGVYACNGKIAEIRISSICRSLAWRLATHSNIINNAAWAAGVTENCDP